MGSCRAERLGDQGYLIWGRHEPLERRDALDLTTLYHALAPPELLEHLIGTAFAQPMTRRPRRTGDVLEPFVALAANHAHCSYSSALDCVRGVIPGRVGSISFGQTDQLWRTLVRSCRRRWGQSLLDEAVHSSNKRARAQGDHVALQSGGTGPKPRHRVPRDHHCRRGGRKWGVPVCIGSKHIHAKSLSSRRRTQRLKAVIALPSGKFPRSTRNERFCEDAGR
jgi:hypothetical protein